MATPALSDSIVRLSLYDRPQPRLAAESPTDLKGREDAPGGNLVHSKMGQPIWLGGGQVLKYLETFRTAPYNEEFSHFK